MMVLFRHGNTFAPGETPRMIGAHEDPPLVASGIAQAEAAARAFAGLRADRVVAGPLARTRRFAELLALGPVMIDERLREVDYGAWAGATDAEITARFGAQALASWRARGVFDAAFEEARESALQRVQACLAELHGLCIVVSSNGLLRTLHPEGAPVGTAKACVLSDRILAWNVSPEEARACLEVAHAQ